MVPLSYLSTYHSHLSWWPWLGSYWSYLRRTSYKQQWTFLSLSYLYLVLSYQEAIGAVQGGQVTGRNGLSYPYLIFILSYLIRELLELSEEDKLQAAMDVAEAVYFIHNLSNPVVHQVMADLYWMHGGWWMKCGRCRLPHTKPFLAKQVNGWDLVFGLPRLCPRFINIVILFLTAQQCSYCYCYCH